MKRSETTVGLQERRGMLRAESLVRVADNAGEDFNGRDVGPGDVARDGSVRRMKGSDDGR